MISPKDMRKGEHKLTAGIIVFLFLLTAFMPVTSASPSDLNEGDSSSSSRTNATRPYVQPPYVEHVGGTMGKHHRPLAAQPQWSVEPNATTVTKSPVISTDAPIGGGGAGSNAHALTVANVGQVAEHKIGFWDIIHLIILPYTATFEVAFNVMPSVTDWIMDIVSPDSEVMKASTMDVHTWDGGGADVFAGTHANWVSNIAPVAGDSVVWNAGALPCTWNLSITLNAFDISAGYSGTITQSVAFGTTGDFNHTSNTGQFFGASDPAKLITVAGNVNIPSTTAGQGASTYFVLTGEAKSVSAPGSFPLKSLRISGNYTATNSVGAHIWVIDVGKTLTANAAITCHDYAAVGTGVTVYGTLTGSGSLTFVIFDRNVVNDFGTGTISVPVTIQLASSAGNSYTLSLGSSTVLGSSLTLYSGHATNTVTLSHGTNYQLTVTGAVTLGARGLMTQGTGTWTFGSYIQTGASSVFTQGGNVVVNGATTLTVGTLTGTTSYIWTSNGGFSKATAFVVTTDRLRLTMTVNGATLAYNSLVYHRIYDLTINENTTFSDSGSLGYGQINHNLIVASGKTLTLNNPIVWQTFNAGSFTNQGTISGVALLFVSFSTMNYSLNIGTVNAPVQIYGRGDQAKNLMCNLSANTVLGGALTVLTDHGSYTLTLFHKANYQLTVAGAVTLGTRGIMTQGTGTWTFGSYTQNGASSVFTQGGAVLVNGNFGLSAGSFAESVTYTLTCSGDVTKSGTGAFGAQGPNLVMNGAGKTLTCAGTPIYKLRASASITNAGAFWTRKVTVDVGVTLSLAVSIDIHCDGSFDFNNYGIIAGPSLLTFYIWTGGKTVTFGVVNSPVTISSYNLVADAVCTLGANTILGSTLLVQSAHATYTTALSHNANYQLTVSGAVTLGTRGVMTQGTGTWTFSAGLVINGVSALFTEGGDVVSAGVTITSGTLTGDALNAHKLTCNGTFANNGGTLTSNTVYLRLGTGGSLAGSVTGTLAGLRIMVSATISLSYNVQGAVAGNGLVVDAGQTMTIAVGQTVTIRYWNTLAYSNLGTIAGTGSVNYQLHNANMTITFGTVNCPAIVDLYSSAAYNRILTLGAAAVFGSTLTVQSSHASYTATLDLSGTNFALSTVGITISARGLLNGRASIITDSANWDSSAGTFNKNTSSVIMTGLTKTIKTANTNGGFYNLQISNAISTISSVNVSHSLTVDSGKTFTIGALLYVDLNCSGGGSFSNPGLIAGTGTMYFSFNTADMNLAFGVINTPVIARTTANALANYTLKLTHGVTFNGTFTARSDAADYYYHVLTIDMAGYTVIFKGTTTITYGAKWLMRTSTVDLYANFDISHGSMTANTSTVRIMTAGLSIWSKGAGTSSYHNLSFMPAAGVTTMQNAFLQEASGILYGGGGVVHIMGFFYKSMNRWSVINGTMAGTGVFDHGPGGCVVFQVTDWNTQIYAGGWTWIGVADIDITGGGGGNLRGFIQSNLACGAALSIFQPAAGTTLNIYMGNWTYTLACDMYLHGGAVGERLFVFGQNSLIIAGRYFWSWDVGVNWYANTSTVRLTGTGGAVDIRMRPGQSFYNLQLQASTVTTSVTTLRVEHNFTLSAGRTLTVGAGLTFTYNGSGGGVWSNAGTVTGGTMYFDYNTADSTITFGDMNSPTQIRAVATATGNRVCTLGAATTFDSSLTVVSTHAIWIITVDAGANQLLGVWGATTLGAHGAMVQGTGMWTFWGTFTENAVTAVFEAGGTINYLSAVTISAGTFNANSAHLLIGHNWDSSGGQFNGMNSVANMSMLGAVAHTSYDYPFNTLNLLVGGSVQANPVLHAKNLTIQSGATLIVLVNGTTVFTFLDLNGTISSASWFVNITASNTNVAWLNGTWNGNIALNGTALFYSLYTRCPMTGSLYTNRTMYLSVNSTSGSIRVTPTNAWTNITLLYINTTFVAIGALVAAWWAGTNTTPAMVIWIPTLLSLAGYSARFDGVLIALGQTTALGKFPITYNGPWSAHLVTIWQETVAVGGGGGAVGNIVCEFTWTINYAVVTFTDKSKGDIVEWHWSFGDGSYNESQDPRHRYTAIGTYTVTLTVIDSHGTVGTRTHLVNITQMMSTDTIFSHIPVWLLLPIMALALFALIGTENRFMRFGCIVALLALVVCMLIGGKLG